MLRPSEGKQTDPSHWADEWAVYWFFLIVDTSVQDSSPIIYSSLDLTQILEGELMYKVITSSSRIPELFAEAIYTRRISFADWYELMTEPLDDSFTQEDGELLIRLIYAVRQGLVKVVDEISCCNFTRTIKKWLNLYTYSLDIFVNKKISFLTKYRDFQ
jgi:hypothetical protein